MVEFAKQDWLAQHRTQSKGWLKRALYLFLRPLFSRYYSGFLSGECLERYRPRWVLGSRGMPLETRRRWGVGYLPDLPGATLLVQGTGTGWDVLSWARLRPRRIIATDMFPFEESWQEIAAYCWNRYRVPVEFRSAPLEDHGFLDSGSVQFIGSDAVYEHCRDLPRVMRESWRLLSPGGYLYASYGPLYCCAGGDHFSGRGGLENSYNHLRLDQGAYRRYLEAHRAPVEDFQDGVRYQELDLFSRLTTGEYLATYREAGLVVKELILELSHQALAYQKRFPREFREIAQTNAGRCTPDDLLIKAHLVILQKPGGPRQPC
jgi:SAM-dependent methyltransferase